MIIKMPSKVAFILHLLCMVACVHITISLPMRFHTDTGRHPRAIIMNEGGSNVTAGTEPAINNATCCNATSPLDCYDGEGHNVSLECCPDVGSAANSTEQLRDRGSLDQGLKTLEVYSAGLFSIIVSSWQGCD